MYVCVRVCVFVCGGVSSFAFPSVEMQHIRDAHAENTPNGGRERVIRENEEGVLGDSSPTAV